MAALPFPKYGIDQLYLYPYHQTREEYERAAGQPCPPFDRTRRPQRWSCPEALAGEEDFVVFDRVLARDPKTGRVLDGPDGRPYTKKLLLPREIAATVNIPPVGTNVAGAEMPEYPCPLRELDPAEELFWDPAMPGVAAVKNTLLYRLPDTGFTAEDRSLLWAIAQKVGA